MKEMLSGAKGQEKTAAGGVDDRFISMAAGASAVRQNLEVRGDEEKWQN